MNVVVIDSGVGNIPNAVRGLARAGADVVLTRDPALVRRAERLVLPGVGAFPAAMALLAGRGLDAAIRDAAARGVPVLGICLGHQLLFESSGEFGPTPGLGLLRGSVVPLPRSARAPHIGWAEIVAPRPDPLVAGLPDHAWVYFVHSFVAVPANGDLVASVGFGGHEVCAAVRRGNVCGVQFHPERSGATGARILANFLELSP